MSKDYVALVYDPKERPFTSYPDLLTVYLAKRFGMQAGSSLLDVGCGRGEFLNGFTKLGIDAEGVDRSLESKKYFPSLKVKQADIESGVLPYQDNTFDFVYSKSVIEHFYYPEKLFSEIFRVLKPGGVIISLTPCWPRIYKIFYDDFTHRTPFTLQSLRDIHHLVQFNNVAVEEFLQLPFLWSRTALIPLFKLFGLISPNWLRKMSKVSRFSYETMLLSSAQKSSIK